MKYASNILAIIGGAAFGLALSALGPERAGIGLAIAAACYLVWSLVRSVRADQRRREIVFTNPTTTWVTFDQTADSGVIVTEKVLRPFIAKSVIKGGKRRRWWR